VKPLINKHLILAKHPGKGGWTYAEVPGIKSDEKRAFGYVRVRGTIDGFEVKGYNLMPMKNGNLFLPVKKEIRNKIKKEEGDLVHIILYRDDEPTETPQEIITCLQEDPTANQMYLSLSEAEKKAFITWIYSAKTEETMIKRIAGMLDKLSRGEKMYKM